MPAIDTRGVDTQLLRNLRGSQASRQQAQRQRSGMPLAPGQAPRSIFGGSADYSRALNEDQDIVELEASLSGQPSGRAFQPSATPGLRASRPGVGSLSLAHGGSAPVGYSSAAEATDSLTQRARQAEVDLLEHAARSGSMDIEDRVLGRIDAAGTRESDFTRNENMLHRYGRRADVARQQAVPDAQASARAFMDPTVTAAREQEVGEQERLLTARYGREADAAAKIEAARIAADSRRDVAQTTAGGGLTREAIRALLKSREMQALVGGQLDPAKTAELENYLWRQAGATDTPAGGSPTGGVDDISLNAMIAGAGVNDLGKEQLASVWDRLTPAQQDRVRQHLVGR